MEEGQYSQHVAGGIPSAYMSMRDYRNQPWQSQQPVERNPNEYMSMRDYRNPPWVSAPSYMVPPQYAPPPHPQSTSPMEEGILDLTKLVGNFVEA